MSKDATIMLFFTLTGLLLFCTCFAKVDWGFGLLFLPLVFASGRLMLEAGKDLVLEILLEYW